MFFGNTPLMRITASDIGAYQRARLEGKLRLKVSFNGGTLNGVCNRTVNMEITLLRQLMRRGKVWSMVAEDVRMLPERRGVTGRVITHEQKQLLFRIAGSRSTWMVAHCAAVLAVSTNLPRGGIA